MASTRVRMTTVYMKINWITIMLNLVRYLVYVEFFIRYATIATSFYQILMNESKLRRCANQFLSVAQNLSVGRSQTKTWMCLVGMKVICVDISLCALFTINNASHIEESFQKYRSIYVYVVLIYFIYVSIVQQGFNHSVKLPQFINSLMYVAFEVMQCFFLMLGSTVMTKQLVAAANIIQCALLWGIFLYRLINERIRLTIGSVLQMDDNVAYWRNGAYTEKQLIFNHICRQLNILRGQHYNLMESIRNIVHFYNLPLALIMCHQFLIIISEDIRAGAEVQVEKYISSIVLASFEAVQFYFIVSACSEISEQMLDQQ
uniref:Uncharacterized protein n=1 Tax=Anopheles atroparvus TaxID=41427 RepID=A0A182J599_ANOAO